jgi:hypothetical protein
MASLVSEGTIAYPKARDTSYIYVGSLDLGLVQKIDKINYNSIIRK